MKKQTILLTALALALAITVGCGTTNTAVPQFTKMAFLSNRIVTPATVMFTSNLDGSNVTPIPFSTTNVWSLSSSADSKTVVFIANSDIWVENSDGSGQKQLTTATNLNWARISPDGKKILYNDGTTNHEWIMNVDGTGSLDITPTFPTGMSQCGFGMFSADSAQVVFVCNGSAGYGIFTALVNGTGMKTVEIRTNNQWLRYPSFTPDGKKILFVGSFAPVAAVQTATSYGVVSVNVDGTGEAVLVQNANESIVLNSILYYQTGNTCNNNLQLNKANVDGTNSVTVGDGTSNNDLFNSGNGC